MQDLLEELLAAQHTDYAAHFSHTAHEISCDRPPSASVRLHYVKPDASGEPRFRELARLLARYIAVYCHKAERLQNLNPIQQAEMYMQARDLFRLSENSGQAGELLIYFLIETVLHAPQALKKMPLTTNPGDERKGSDGVHILWDEQLSILEFIFAESKIWQSYSDALRDAFKSMEAFHDSKTRSLEVNTFASGYSNLTPELQKKILPYIEGDLVSQCRLAHACLIGFNWKEYECLSDGRREQFIVEFDDRYRTWASTKRDSLNEKLKRFKHKNLRFEFFMLPFRDVEMFRRWFLEELTGNK